MGDPTPSPGAAFQRAADHGLVFGQQDADHRRWRGVSVMARR